MAGLRHPRDVIVFQKSNSWNGRENLTMLETAASEVSPASVESWLRIARFGVDSGLLVLIWMVQLIVYPSFLHVSNEALESWHNAYSARITVIVMPLMFLQVGLLLAQAATGLRVPVLLAGALVAAAWLSTFFQAVPTHSAIAATAAAGEGAQESIHRLVAVNWPRTILWSLVWLLATFDLLRR